VPRGRPWTGICRVRVADWELAYAPPRSKQSLYPRLNLLHLDCLGLREATGGRGALNGWLAGPIRM
jgi:hypothetical protein